MSMVETHARYACDRCRSRKASCNRSLAGCQRCVDEAQVRCVYSRAGVIRRKRKPPSNLHTPPSDESTNAASVIDTPITTPGTGASKSLLVSATPATAPSTIFPSANEADGGDIAIDIDIETARQRLGTGDLSQQHKTLGALASISEAYVAVWHDDPALRTGSSYFLFEDKAESWADAFIDHLERGRPLTQPAPREVLQLLRSSRPHEVSERAWLVMYYGVVLSMVSSTNPEDHDTKSKLRCNLWLALNDVRILLEPSEANIQALVILAMHVEEFTTPLLSWMLVSNACRMLQAIGIQRRRFDDETRARRTMLFWHLNLLDKGHALFFGRPPTFHRAMAMEVPLPALSQMLWFQPHQRSSSNAVPGLFGPHFMHQLFLLTRVNANVCYCIYDCTSPDDSYIEKESQKVDTAYGEALELLEAAARAEKPFLDAAGAASIDLGLRTLAFYRLHLKLMLVRSSISGSANMKAQCIDYSKTLLYLLGDMVSDSQEPFNGIIWHLICCPFTPFLILFSEILSGHSDNELLLDAVEQFPIFLGKMGLRNSLALKLERVATVLFKHAQSVIRHGPVGSNIVQESWASDCEWSFFPGLGTTDYRDVDLSAWANDLLADGGIDWIGDDAFVG